MSNVKKAIVAAITAAAITVKSALDNHTGVDWLTVILAALGAVGVYFVPNDPNSARQINRV